MNLKPNWHVIDGVLMCNVSVKFAENPAMMIELQEEAREFGEVQGMNVSEVKVSDFGHNLVIVAFR